MKLLLVFVIISALIFSTTASGDGESQSSSLDYKKELELLLVIDLCIPGEPNCHSASDLAIGDSGNIYVADYGGDRIQIFNSLGQVIQTIELKGAPHGITLDKDENIYVTTFWTWKGVEKFTKIDSPNTFSHFPSPATDFEIEDQSIFGLPADVVVDPNGIVYVMEHRNLDICCGKASKDGIDDFGDDAGVHKLSADGTYLEFIRVPETAITDIAKFGLMTMDRNGYLYLADQRGNKIIELDPSNGNGRELALINFNRPNSVTFNADGYMFVADNTSTGPIHIFDEYHQLVRTIGEYGTEDGKISGTHGLEFDKNGNMYVLSYDNYRIQVFHIASEVFGESISEETEEPSISDVSSQPACGQGTVLKNGVCVVEESKSGGCLIATATFGSEMAPQVQFLREIRDNTVLQTESGVSFMVGFNQFYYSFSPAIADYERENPVFKELVKLTITPLLTSLTILNYVDIDTEEEMLGYGIGVILLNIGMYFIAPAAILFKIKNRK